jgi:hypothetical protein
MKRDGKTKSIDGKWRQTLESFAFPIIGNLPVAAVDTADVLKILEQIWLDKNETASDCAGD